jgi:hypothetical protein
MGMLYLSAEDSMSAIEEIRRQLAARTRRERERAVEELQQGDINLFNAVFAGVTLNIPPSLTVGMMTDRNSGIGLPIVDWAPMSAELVRVFVNGPSDAQAEWRKDRKIEEVKLLECELAIRSMPLSELVSLFPNLIAIKLQKWSKTSIKGIEAAPTIKYVNLSSSKVKSIAPLAKLPQLKWLSLYQCHGVTNVKPLESMTSLESLNLSRPPFKGGRTSYEGEWMSSLVSLSNCEKLRRLELYGATTRSLNGLEGLTGLTYIDVSRCELLTDVSAIKNLPNLRCFLSAHTTFKPRPKRPDLLERTAVEALQRKM